MTEPILFRLAYGNRGKTKNPRLIMKRGFIVRRINLQIRKW